jgi:hypothetical protein
VPASLVVVCPVHELLRWPSAGLELYFVEWQDTDGALVCTGTPRLVAWGVGSRLGADPTAAGPSVRLTTADGIGVGTTVAQLDRLAATPAFMQWRPDLAYPAGFSLGDPLPGEQLFGVLSWDWATDLQTALNRQGAGLAGDGELGPAPRAALDGYRQEHGLATVEEAILALDLEPSGDVPIASLASGRFFIEFECGTFAELSTC